MDCPCKGCQDRNATCHMKGHCRHGYTEWAKEHEARREEERRRKPFYTEASEKRHRAWIKRQGEPKSRIE